MTKIPLKDKLALGLFIVALLANPLSNQYVVDVTVRGLIYVSREFGVYVTIIAAVYFTGYILYNAWASREKVNIPKKSAKTLKAGKLIET